MRTTVTSIITAGVFLAGGLTGDAITQDVPVECQPIMRDLYTTTRTLDGVQATATDLYSRLVDEQAHRARVEEQLLDERTRVARLRARIERIRARR